MIALAGAFVLAAAAHATGARLSAADACHLLTTREVAAVQGESFTAVRLTTRGGNSQCFYQLPSFTKSVSVDVIREGGRDFWRSHFERGGDAEEGKGESAREGEEEESLAPPREVGGVGSEAFWTGGRMSGSLYVRKGDAVLRVSVGGPGSNTQKLERSKTLARKALLRM